MTALLLALSLAQAPQARVFALDPVHSHVRFHLDHALHKVDGEAKQVEAKAQLGADGTLKAMARASVASFDTGDGNRDANLRVTMDVDKHPYVVLKGTAQLPPVPAAFQASVPVTLEGEVDVHGVKRPVKIPLQVSFTDHDTARVQGAFAVSLESHRVERPALLFKKVDDAVKISVDLLLHTERN